MPDKTLHKSGCVADARCGVRLIIGHDCAKTHVPGWSRVIGALKELDQQHAAMTKVSRLSEFRARIAQIDLRLARIPQVTVANSDVLSDMNDAHRNMRQVADMAGELSHASPAEVLKRFGGLMDRAERAIVSAEATTSDLVAKEITRQQRLTDNQAPQVRRDVAAEFKSAGKRR